MRVQPTQAYGSLSVSDIDQLAASKRPSSNGGNALHDPKEKVVHDLLSTEISYLFDLNSWESVSSPYYYLHLN